MAVERIDAQIASLISGAQVQTQKEIDKGEEADRARRAVEKKAAEKRDAVQQQLSNKEVFQRQNGVDQRLQQILGGAAGADAAHALQHWENNSSLQAKLTQAQKSLFREAMAANPAQGAAAGNALNRLSQTPGFQQAVNTAPIAGTLQEGIVQNPQLERPVADVLQNRFMQHPKADPQTKNQFLRFTMQRAGQGQLDVIKRSGDMLGTLAGNNIGRSAQRAAMGMVQRRPGDAAATSNVDAFVQQPPVAKMPSFARTKSTELLALANGTSEVREGFETLASNPKFRSQTAQNKGRIFSTIGSGRPSEFRSLTDKVLVALQSPGFPTRSAQVGKFLNKVAGQAQSAGAGGVEPEALIRQAKSSPLPRAPVLTSPVGLSEEDANRVRAENRGKLIQYFTQVMRGYEHAERKLTGAKYFEDVNNLQNLRPAEPVDVSGLPAEDQAFAADRMSMINEKLDTLQKLQRQRARELRTKRMPLAKRRAMREERKAVGRQPKYFNPSSGRIPASQAYARAVGAPPPQQQGLPQTPLRGQLANRATGGAMPDLQQQVAQVVAQMGGGQLTPGNAGRVAQAIAQQVAHQVAQQVTEQLLSSFGAGSAAPAGAPPQAQPQARARGQQGKVDGWGIPRSFERDLGGADRAATKPPIASTVAEDFAVSEEPYTGKLLVKDPSAVRSLTTLMPTRWKELAKPEMALLKNLGWNQQAWDTKDSPAAKWPTIMATPFVNLSPLQRESVRKLGMSPADWDKRVQALAMGKNA